MASEHTTGAAAPTDDRFVPGQMHCARCNFQLTRTVLYMGNGAVGAGDSKTEPCPNGCGPLWPVTWEQAAREAWATCETLFERAKVAEDRLAAVAPPQLVAGGAPHASAPAPAQGYIEQHHRDSSMLRQLCQERDDAMAASRKHGDALQRIGTALGLLPGADLHRECMPAIERLIAAAAPAQSVEPVAWRCDWGDDGWTQFHHEDDPLPKTWDSPPDTITPLYSAPAAGDEALLADSLEIIGQLVACHDDTDPVCPAIGVADEISARLRARLEKEKPHHG